MHSFTCTGKPEYYSTCIECRAKKNRIINRRNKERKLEYRKARAYHYKLELIRILGGKCAECGETDPVVLTFHHVNPKDKKINISVILNRGASMNRKDVIEEVRKCQLLCMNCHMRKEWESSRKCAEKYFKNNIKFKTMKWED